MTSNILVLPFSIHEEREGPRASRMSNWKFSFAFKSFFEELIESGEETEWPHQNTTASHREQWDSREIVGELGL